MNKVVLVMYLLMIALVALLTVQPVTAEEGYAHSDSQCLRCHENKQELQAILFSTLDSCNNCHG